MLQHSRISSEAPEVVPNQPQPPISSPLSPAHPLENLFQSPTWKTYYCREETETDSHIDNDIPTPPVKQNTDANTISAEPSIFSQQATKVKKDTQDRREEEEVEERTTVTKARNSNPYLDAYPIERFEQQSKRSRKRRVLTTILLLSVAFLLGGGVGGGVGSSIAARRSRNLTPQPTPLIPLPPPSPPTKILDYAGCPSVNNQTYSTPSTPPKSFLKLCSHEITPLIPSTSSSQEASGKHFEMRNATMGSLDSCLDWCASVEGCEGATWYIFYEKDPRWNSVCFLKRGKGKDVVSEDARGGGRGMGGGVQVASGVLV